jgi:hypothetical protein
MIKPAGGSPDAVLLWRKSEVFFSYYSTLLHDLIFAMNGHAVA